MRVGIGFGFLVVGKLVACSLIYWLAGRQNPSGSTVLRCLLPPNLCRAAVEAAAPAPAATQTAGWLAEAVVTESALQTENDAISFYLCTEPASQHAPIGRRNQFSLQLHVLKTNTPR